MQLKRFTDLSLRMLMHLAHTAKPGEPVPVPVLAETLQWNPNLVICLLYTSPSPRDTR